MTYAQFEELLLNNGVENLIRLSKFIEAREGFNVYEIILDTGEVAHWEVRSELVP